MKLWTSFRTLLDYVLRRSRAEQEMQEELQSHLASRADDLERQGLARAEAERRARVEFGGYERYKEECREALGWRLLHEFIADVRYGLRMLGKNPGFTVLVTGLLAFGIGATTVIFSLFDAVFLRPLAVRRPGELVRMVQPYLPKLPPQSRFPYAYYETLRDHATTIAGTFGETGEYRYFPMSDPEPAEEITVHGVTPEFFTVLGVRARYGRVLLPDDDNVHPGLPPAVLSYNFWQRRFRGDPNAVGKGTLMVAGHRFVIVGVTPSDFNGLTVDTAPDVRIPLRTYLLLGSPREENWFELAARLKPGVSRSQAEAECKVLWRSTMEDYFRKAKLSPLAISTRLAIGMELESVARGVSIIRERYGEVLGLLMASVAVLLVIICINIAGLLLQRGAARQQEITVRLAVGATRWRLVRQVLAENVILAVLGTAAGTIVAAAGMPLALRALPPIRLYPSASLMPISVDVGISWRIFAFLLALSLAAMLLFSIGPALAVSHWNLESLLRGVRSSAAVRQRQAFITLEIALCTVLLAMAALFVRTFRQLRHVDPGFDRDHIATFTISPNANAANAAAFLKTFTERVRAIPGVLSVGVSSNGVLRGSGMAMSAAPAGQRITPADFMATSLNDVSPEYFSAMGMRIISGRTFISSDAPDPKRAGPAMVVVNQAFVRHFFPDSQPLGKRFGPGAIGNVAREKFEIVGVVNDAKYRSLRAPMVPTFYEYGIDYGECVVNVRTNRRANAIIAPVRKTLEALDPGLPFLEVHTMEEEAASSMGGERITAALASLFGGIAALLVGVGIYGLLAYLVMQRRREIGIRMALGAQPTQIGKLIVVETLGMIAAGTIVGLGAAVAAGHVIRSILYGVSAQDPKSYIAATILVALTAAAGAILPAVRAARVDPIVALRYE